MILTFTTNQGEQVEFIDHNEMLSSKRVRIQDIEIVSECENPDKVIRDIVNDINGDH